MSPAKGQPLLSTAAPNSGLLRAPPGRVQQQMPRSFPQRRLVFVEDCPCQAEAQTQLAPGGHGRKDGGGVRQWLARIHKMPQGNTKDIGVSGNSGSPLCVGVLANLTTRVLVFWGLEGGPPIYETYHVEVSGKNVRDVVNGCCRDLAQAVGLLPAHAELGSREWIPVSRRIIQESYPESQKLCKIVAFWQFLGVLGVYVAYFWVQAVMILVRFLAMFITFSTQPRHSNQQGHLSVFSLPGLKPQRAIVLTP